MQPVETNKRLKIAVVRKYPGTDHDVAEIVTEDETRCMTMFGALGAVDAARIVALWNADVDACGSSGP
jgi:hypothetical protein